MYAVYPSAVIVSAKTTVRTVNAKIIGENAIVPILVFVFGKVGKIREKSNTSELTGKDREEKTIVMFC